MPKRNKQTHWICNDGMCDDYSMIVILLRFYLYNRDDGNTKSIDSMKNPWRVTGTSVNIQFEYEEYAIGLERFQ